MELASLFVQPNTPVLTAMRIIDSGSAQIALVVDNQQRLIGTLTDGDIRRALISGEPLTAAAESLMNTNFRFVRVDDDESVAISMMKKESLRQIPVLDESNHVLKLLHIDDLFKNKELTNSVVLMAGGKGTRLRPHTQNCPKPMLPVGGKPMLEILLNRCIDSGFKKFYFSVNYLKDMIIEYFKDGSDWNVSIEYLIESEPLGTAGSLQLLPKSLDAPFLVMNGDVLTKLDPFHLLNFHLEHQADATLCVREHEQTVHYGVVETDGIKLDCIREKPINRYLVNAGVYILDPSLIKLVSPNQFLDMPTLLQKANDKGFVVNVCPIHEYWIDVGRPETLKQASSEWLHS